MSIDKDFYNRSSATALSWDPSWFQATDFDDLLIQQVRIWQRAHGLPADGLVGPMTYRRIWTEREAQISDYEPTVVQESDSNHIVCNGNFVAIDWPKVVIWDEPQGLTTNPGQYYDYAGKPDRKPTMFVNHWDVALSAKKCANILGKRGISIHFCLDNDGTIYQLLDTQHGAWHAGGRLWNHRSIGVEISNAYYPKYQEWYERHGFGPRPIQSNAWCHGQKMPDFLDFYEIQTQALKALWKAVAEAYSIPLECPTDANGCLVTTVDKRCTDGEFHGFLNHYNLTRGKIDCAGLDLVNLLKECKETI